MSEIRWRDAGRFRSGAGLLCVAVLALLPSLLAAGCNQRCTLGGDPALPFVVIERTAHIQPPPESTGYFAPLLAAVWEDGQIIRAVETDGEVTSWVRGQLTEEQVAAVRASVNRYDLNVAPPPVDWWVVDSATEQLYLRCGNLLLHRLQSLPLAEGEASLLGDLISDIMALPLSDEEPLSGTWEFGDLPAEWFD
jgi:hypothetical protein